VRPHFAILSVVSDRRPGTEALVDGVHTGDAFDLVGRVPDDAVDLVVTSPPYWGLRSYGLPHDEKVLDRWQETGCDASRVPPYDWYRQHGGVLGLEPYPHWFVAHLVEFFGRARRVLSDTGSLWVNLGDTYFARWSSVRDGGRQGLTGERQRRRTPSGGYLHDKQLLLIPARFAIAMQDQGWILRNDLIWAKPNPIPRPEGDRLRLAHEHWLHFVQRTRGARPSYYYALDQAEGGARDVVSYPVSAGSNGHSATFPPELVRRRIVTSCPPGGLVLDPFCGVGTALTEAARTGRVAIGFDASTKYAEVARRSLHEVQLQGLPNSGRVNERVSAKRAANA
jgi:site-specific DNA-methyltransferase (cytosine-N4-specific)